MFSHSQEAWSIGNGKGWVERLGLLLLKRIVKKNVMRALWLGHLLLKRIVKKNVMRALWLGPLLLKRIVKKNVMRALWLGPLLLKRIVKKNVASGRGTISIPTLFSILKLEV
jgi:hypothetical protein